MLNQFLLGSTLNGEACSVRSMSGNGYQQTLDAPRGEVRLPLGSRRWSGEFRKQRDLGLDTAPKRTSPDAPANVCW